jgi:hypothetical protein
MVFRVKAFSHAEGVQPAFGAKGERVIERTQQRLFVTGESIVGGREGVPHEQVCCRKVELPDDCRFSQCGGRGTFPGLRSFYLSTLLSTSLMFPVAEDPA